MATILNFAPKIKNVLAVSPDMGKYRSASYMGLVIPAVILPPPKLPKVGVVVG